MHHAHRGEGRPHRRGARLASCGISVMRLRRRLAHERHPDNDLSMTAMAVLGALHRNGDLTVGGAGRARGRPAAEHDPHRQAPRARRAWSARRAHETTAGWSSVSLTDTGRATVLADRRRRDEWLAQRLRELDPARSAPSCAAAAPILERLSQHRQD